MRVPARAILLLLLVSAVALVFVALSPGGSRPATAINATPLQVKWGDSDCDNAIDAWDVLTVEQSLLGIPQSWNSCQGGLAVKSHVHAVTANALDFSGFWGDFNCDQHTDGNDALLLLKSIAQVPVYQTLGCALLGDQSNVTITISGEPPPLPEIAVDAITSGNSANSLGPIDNCVEAAVGSTFNVDVVVKGVPTFTPYIGGLGGFDFAFDYNPQVLEVTTVDDGVMLAASGASNIVRYTETPPDTDGYFLVRAYDLSNNPEQGDGVLVRLKLHAIAAGDSTLDLSAPWYAGVPIAPGGGPHPGGLPQVLDNENYIYTINSKVPATAHVGGPADQCGLPTPTPSPTPSPTPGPDTQCPSGSPIDIPDNDTNGISDTKTINDAGTIASMTMCVNISSVWAGDLNATLTNEDTGHSITLFEQLGGGHTGTCSANGNGIYVLLTDDEQAIVKSLEEACEDGDDLIGTFPPEEPFVTGNGPFGGDPIAGHWTLHISDNHADGFTAQLLGWQLHFNQ